MKRSSVSTTDEQPQKRIQLSAAFTYPLTFSNAAQHEAHVRTNWEWYMKQHPQQAVVDTTELQKAQVQLAAMRALVGAHDLKIEEHMKIQADISEQLRLAREQVVIMEKKRSVDSSVHKGEGFELYVADVLRQILQREKYTATWLLDTEKKMKCMDLRLTSGDKTCGIECKNKNIITKDDIDKFRRDHVDKQNAYSVFISTAPINGVLMTENTFKLDTDMAWIYAKDEVFFIAIMACIVEMVCKKCVEDSDTITTRLKQSTDALFNVYAAWQAGKKALRKTDEAVLAAMRVARIESGDGHVYFRTRSGGIY